MLVLRLALVLAGLGLLASLLLWVITRDRRYLRWAGRLLQILLLLILLFLALLFGGRLLATRGL
jgi:cytochrome c biogenesis protein CcdA